MNFLSKELSITDDADFGCAIEFSDKKHADNIEKPDNRRID